MGEVPCIAMVASPDELMAGQGDTLLKTLAPYETAKAQAFKSATARISYIAAHVLVRRAAAAVTGQRAQDLELRQRCVQCGGSHGQPVIVDHPRLHVSLSHADGAVAAVAGSLPNAIDVEAWNKMRVSDLLGAKVFSDGEREALGRIKDAQALDLAALRLWVRKECLVKLGRLSLDTMGTCDLSRLDSQSSESLEPAASAASASLTRTKFDGLLFTDWMQADRRVSGAIATMEPVDLIVLP